MNLIGDNNQLFGWSTSTWLWLDQAGILLGNIMVIISILGALWAFINRNRLRRWLRSELPVTGIDAEDNAQWDALVFSISRYDLPQWIIDTRKPKAIGLISSAQSHAAAEKLSQYARKQQIAVTGPKRLDDPDNPVETQEETQRVIKRLREQGHQRIAVDITGGKTPMSIGAFLAAREENCDVIYIVSEYDSSLKQPNTSSARIRCFIRHSE